MSRLFLTRGMGTPRWSILARSSLVVVSAGSQVMFHAAASALAAFQISYPTPPSEEETPLLRPQPLVPTTAATVTRDAHTWLAPLRFTMTRVSRPASAASAISTTGQNRRRMTALTLAAARAIADPASTHAPMLGCTLTSVSATSTDRHTQPWTRSALSTVSASGNHVSAPGDLIRPLLASTQSAQLSRDLDTMAATPVGSCVPVPLSSVCRPVIDVRPNRPNSALGLAAGDSLPRAAMEGSHTRSLSARPSW